MNKHLKLLLSGTGFAAIILGIGLFGKHRTELRIANLVAACKEEDKKPGGFKDLGGELLCDPRELEESDDKARRKYDYRPSPGVQGELVAARRRLWFWQEIPPPIAVLGFIIAALPWSWYFLLARIKEAREALIGK